MEARTLYEAAQGSFNKESVITVFIEHFLEPGIATHKWQRALGAPDSSLPEL